MARKSRRTGRSRKDDDSEEEQSQDNNDDNSNDCHKDMNFAEKRDHQRKKAAEKRRSKMKCYLCGQSGHVRRECPGIADDGRGESKFTKSNGDTGATTLKSGKKKQRGQKVIKQDDNDEENILTLPSGFSKGKTVGDVHHTTTSSNAALDEEDELNSNDIPLCDENKEQFEYFDTGFDAMASLTYLRTGRGKNKLSAREAIGEYDATIEEAFRTSNFGGGISRTYINRDKVPWSVEKAFPFQQVSNTFFVIGFGSKFQCNDDEVDESIDVLSEIFHANESIVGVFADIDFTHGKDRQVQIQRLRCTLEVATKNSCPIQIRTSPRPASNPKAKYDNKEPMVVSDPYAEVMRELEEIILQATVADDNLKIHLSCWSGNADHMTALLQRFPNNVWIGFDGSVSFNKTTWLHECTFDVPLEKILLETGSPDTIPSVVAKAQGREAFCHSGLIPFIAEAVAYRKDPSLKHVTGEMVARNATANTLLLYPQLKYRKEAIKSR